MDNLNKLNDMLHTEMMNQSMYNKYMMEIQKPELRQMFMQMRDSKMQQITQLQQEIKNMMSGQ
jgi:ferritin-like metal-binding protein YciE